MLLYNCCHLAAYELKSSSFRHKSTGKRREHCSNLVAPLIIMIVKNYQLLLSEVSRPTLLGFLRAALKELLSLAPLLPRSSLEGRTTGCQSSVSSAWRLTRVSPKQPPRTAPPWTQTICRTDSRRMRDEDAFRKRRKCDTSEWGCMDQSVML